MITSTANKQVKHIIQLQKKARLRREENVFIAEGPRMVIETPKKIVANVGKNKIKLTEVTSLEAFKAGENVYFYNQSPNLNQFATPGSDFAKEVITKNPQLLVKLAASDITAATTTLTVKGFAFAAADKYRISTGT